MSQDLAPWIIRTLKRDYEVEADPKSLSNFIVALVGKHKHSSSLKPKCINSLREFFGGSTENFVNSLVRRVEGERSPSPSPSTHRTRDERPRREESPVEPSPRRKRRVSEDREERPPKRRRQSEYRDLDRPSPRAREEGEVSPPPERSHSRRHDNPGLETWETDREQRSRGRDRYPRHGRDGRDRGGRGGDRDRRGARHAGNRDNTTLAVTNIPKEFNNIASLNEHFSQFGTIVSVDLKSSHKAQVKFTHHQAAQKAYKSPEPIFGNRFIKVFWHKDGDSRASPNKDAAASTPAARPPPPTMSVPQNVPPSARKFPPASRPAPKDSAQEAAKLQQLKEIQLQKEELRKKQLEEQQTLMKMLSSPNLDQETKVTLFKQLKTLTDSIEASIKKDSSLLATVRQRTSPAEKPTDPSDEERIAKMEDKRNQLQEKASSILYATRGYPRGRGAPRGYSSRGRGFAPRGRGWHATPRGPLSIDNRTRTIKIDSPPAPLLHEETLTSFFKKFGTIENVEIEEQSVAVQFSQRREAESAMRGGTMYEEHPLTLSWKEKTYEEESTEPSPEESTGAAESAEDPVASGETETPTNEASNATEEASGLSSDEEYWNH